MWSFTRWKYSKQQSKRTIKENLWDFTRQRSTKNHHNSVHRKTIGFHMNGILRVPAVIRCFCKARCCRLHRPHKYMTGNKLSRVDRCGRNAFKALCCSYTTGTVGNLVRIRASVIAVSGSAFSQIESAKWLNNRWPYGEGAGISIL